MRGIDKLSLEGIDDHTFLLPSTGGDEGSGDVRSTWTLRGGEHRRVAVDERWDVEPPASPGRVGVP